jgi:Fe-Mn family superoxide dismutase
MTHELPPLPYDYKALEPYLDARTMEIHHDKHHAAYTAKFNDIVAGTPEIQGKTGEELLLHLDIMVPEGALTGVRNFGGGHVNHSFFWTVLAPENQGGGGEASGSLAEAITRDFGSFSLFREQFTKTANTVFGSGWTWLAATKEGKLSILSTPNQDSPLSRGLTPVMTLDEWEHAYYLSYQNKRPDYVEAFWHIANWAQADAYYKGR